MTPKCQRRITFISNKDHLVGKKKPLHWGMTQWLGSKKCARSSEQDMYWWLLVIINFKKKIFSKCISIEEETRIQLTIKYMYMYLFLNDV